MSHYETLGVSPSASQAEITAAYRRRAKETHPDNGGDAEDFKAVEIAGRTLRDIAARQKYDESGQDANGPKEPTLEERAAEMFLMAAAEIPPRTGPNKRLREIRKRIDTIRKAQLADKKELLADIAALEAMEDCFTMPGSNLLELARLRDLEALRTKLKGLDQFIECLALVDQLAAGVLLTKKGEAMARKEGSPPTAAGFTSLQEMLVDPRCAPFFNGAKWP